MLPPRARLKVKGNGRGYQRIQYQINRAVSEAQITGLGTLGVEAPSGGGRLAQSRASNSNWTGARPSVTFQGQETLLGQTRSQELGK